MGHGPHFLSSQMEHQKFAELLTSMLSLDSSSDKYIEDAASEIRPEFHGLINDMLLAAVSHELRHVGGIVEKPRMVDIVCRCLIIRDSLERSVDELFRRTVFWRAASREIELALGTKVDGEVEMR